MAEQCAVQYLAAHQFHIPSHRMVDLLLVNAGADLGLIMQLLLESISVGYSLPML